MQAGGAIALHPADGVIHQHALAHDAHDSIANHADFDGLRVRLEGRAQFVKIVCGNRIVVIEVNDNPSIDAGVEDEYLGEDLYRRIMEEFLRRLERKRLGMTD